MLYEINDIFMVRTPALPIKYFTEYKESDKDIYEYIKSNTNLDLFFRKALLVSSPTLYYSYINKPVDEKKYKNLLKGLLNYFIRTTTRPTPFGYLANVSLGEFEHKTYIEKNLDELIIDIKVDSNWVNLVISSIEKNQNILNFLKIQINDIVYKSGDRFKNPHYSNKGILDENNWNINSKGIDIRYTALTKLIAELTKEKILYFDLINIILKEYEGIDIEIVTRTINTLLDKEYLLTDLRIPAYNKNPLNHVINVLKENPHANKEYSKLKHINDLISRFNFSSDDQELLKIIKEMKAVHKSKNYLELNVGSTYIKNNLSYNIKNRILNFIEVLSTISLELNPLRQLYSLKDAFLEEYGVGVEVSILDVIDINKFDGLQYLEKRENLNYKNHGFVLNIIKDKILAGIINNEDVFLYKKDFENINNMLDEKLLPEGFDINVFISGAIGEENITLSPLKGTSSSGCMFQRFQDCFDESLFEKYINTNRKNESKYLEVEIRERFKGKVNNVVNKSKVTDNYITISCLGNEKGKLEFKDLYIGMDDNHRMYIKHKNFNRKIKVVKNNMMNVLLASKIYQLLYGISYLYENDLFIMLEMIQEDWVYFPKVIIEGITINTKKYNLNNTVIKAKTLDEFKKDFYVAKKKYKISDLVYLCNSDNRILVDTSSDDLEILFNDFKKTNKIRLCEPEEDLLNSNIVNSKNGDSFVSEFSCTALRNDNRISISTESNISYNSKLDEKDRLNILFNDGWIYFKLFGTGNRTNELIKNQLYELLNRITYEKWFFLRYEDVQGKHLRIRIKFKNEFVAMQEIHHIYTWLNDKIKKNVISNVVFDTYKKESNRYGGSSLIEYCEDIFCEDSNLVQYIYQKYYKNRIETDYLEKIYILGVITLLNGLLKSKKEIYNLLESSIEKNYHRNEYQKKRNYYKELISKFLDNNLDGFEDLKNILLKRDEKAKIFANKLNIEKNINFITNTENHIYLSIIHMFCNRMTGENNIESKTLAIIRHALYDLIQQKNAN